MSCWPVDLTSTVTESLSSERKVTSVLTGNTIPRR
jgi:hypothetical protein